MSFARPFVSGLAALSLLACGVDEAPLVAAEDVATATEALCAAQPSYLQNGSFQTAGPLGGVTSVTTSLPGGAGYSAASGWTLFTRCT